MKLLNKKLFSIILCLTLFACSSNKRSMQDYPTLSFKELDQKIENKETFIAYFGWTTNCGDSITFQDGYFLKEDFTDPNKHNIVVVDLDKELPEALSNKELRSTMFETYGVNSSPTLVYYENGVQTSILAWTTLNSSDETGILKSELDSFFSSIFK